MSIVTSRSADKQFRQRLDQARVDALTPLNRNDVSEIVHQILASMGGDLAAGDIKLYKELEELARYIHHAKSEIAAIRPQDIRETHIPIVTDELDAVVGATEVATNSIMDACDVISALAAKLEPEYGNLLIEEVTRVYEACNFQDITGQRITKVVRTLKTIESKVDALIVAFGEQATQSEAHAVNGAEAPAANGPEVVAVVGAGAEAGAGALDADFDSDMALMHGPALPGSAIDQDEIDRLLASFD
ncbi:MAG: protein phosphatase CheZ [Rhodospirillaceae bacterium]